MKVTPSEIAGLRLIEPEVFGDARGCFVETWNARHYREQGLACDFAQDNLSVSRRGVLRGLHFQNPTPQAKLISVLAGEVYDVAVDLRRSSRTFGRWDAATLSEANRRQFFIPAGFAHGFLVVSETATVAYKCSDFYAPEHELTLAWDDPDLAIPWPIRTPELSAKDRRGVRLRDIPPDRLFP